MLDLAEMNLLLKKELVHLIQVSHMFYNSTAAILYCRPTYGNIVMSTGIQKNADVPVLVRCFPNILFTKI